MLQIKRSLHVVLCVVSTYLAVTGAARAADSAAVLPPGLAVAGVESSEQLLAELNCVSCHPAPRALDDRLLKRQAPLLGEVGSRVTASYLRAFLDDPQATKPGTVMPDILHGFRDAVKKEVVEDLVHFLASLEGVETPVEVEADGFEIALGKQLFHEVGCVACHEPQEDAVAPNASELERTLRALRLQQARRDGSAEYESVPLGDLARKTTVGQLAAFLRDPASVRPAGRMPSLRLSTEESEAIAMYLLRGQMDSGTQADVVVRGVKYEYFEHRFESVAAESFAGLKRAAVGKAPKFTIEPRARNDRIGFRFTGLIELPAAGKYTFFTHSDDGSRLYLGDRLVVDNDGVHGGTEVSGEIELDAGRHPIMVTWFEAAGGEELRVSYAGPGIEKQEIPSDALLHVGRAMRPSGYEKLTPDPDRARRGAELFASLGCASCHRELGRSDPRLVTRLDTKPLAQLDLDAAASCLGAEAERSVPAYSLTSAQRQSLRSVIERLDDLGAPLDSKTRVARGMAAHGCVVCHRRDGVGGPSPRRNDYFRPHVEADLGDEGRIPPQLDFVGAKLQPDWMQTVLFHGGTARPYMATRMPQFGEAAIGWLPELLREVDGYTADAAEPPADVSELVTHGRTLTGTKGLSCVTCHSYGTYASLGIPALDLAKMTRRVTFDWFRRYLLTPQSMKPGTRMPEFWPEGKATLGEVLDGDTERQIAALWHYLAKGQSVKIPFGLKRSGMELVAQDGQAVVYRGFIKGGGSRAIAVGYPEEINLCWDANEQRLAMLWKGHFIDASMQRTGRGSGWQEPLGRDVVSLVGGAPIALLESGSAAWPDVAGKAAGFRMRGYRLDARRRPTFLYSLGYVAVTDFPEAVEERGESFLRRTLSFHAPAADVTDVWFRAALDGSIERQDDGSYRVGDALHLRFVSSGGGEVLVRPAGDAKELVVRVPLSGGEGTLVETINW